MKKQIFQNVVTDVAIFAGLYLGLVEGWEPATNAVVFVVWFISLSSMVCGVAWKTAVKQMDVSKVEATRRKYRSGAWRIYDIATDVLAAVVMAGAGWFVTAAVFAIGQSMLKGEVYKWARREGAPA